MIIDIKEYILRSKESGISDNVIKTALINMGHSREEIEQVYVQVLGATATESGNYFTPNNNIQFGNQPAVATPEEVAEQAIAVEEGKKKNKKIFAIVGLVVVFLAMAGSGLAYYNYVQNSPENVIKKFNLAWPKIQSFRNKLDFTAVVSSETADRQAEFKVESVGSFDFSGKAKVTNEIRASSEALGNLSPIGFKFAYVNDFLYLQSWDFGKFPFADLSGLNGLWVRMNAESVDKSGSSFGFKINSERLIGAGERFREAMQDPPLVFSKKLPEDTIGGVGAYHYLFNLDLIKFEDFMGKVGNLTAEEIARAKEASAYRYKNITTSTLELWIYKKSYMPARFLILLEGKGEGSFTDSFKIENTFSDINVALTISEPNNYKDLQVIFEEISAQIVKNHESIESSSTTTPFATSSEPTQ